MCLDIGGRAIGTSRPLFVIAELGLNHGGSLETALALVDAAASAGASAVKLQTIDADRLVAPDGAGLAHVPAASLRDFFRRFELDEEAHRAVAERARARGLAMLATPFSEEAVDRLDRVGCDALKIASGDITHTRLIDRAARTGRPLVISTGMSDLREIADALACARGAGARQVALLHCVSAYPVPVGSENLRAIAELSRVFAVPVGLSDHSVEPMAPMLAVALGASLYERHLMLSGAPDGVDAAVSSTPDDLAARVAAAERARRALGLGRKVCLPAEQENLQASRRSLYAARALRRGEVVGEADVVALRPARGLDAARWRDLQGRTLDRDVPAGGVFLDSDLGVGHERRTCAHVT